MTLLTSQSDLSLNSKTLDDIRLGDIVKTIPKEVFYKNRRKAWTQLLISVVTFGLGLWALSVAPWYLLPPLWIFTGTALTGWFVVGHDCGHNSFANRKWVNNLVGHIMLFPILYPFHNWQFTHNRHHKYTNNLDFDTAWTPFTSEMYDNLPKPLQWGYQVLRGRLWFFASITHCLHQYLNWAGVEGANSKKLRFSAWFVIIGASIALPLIVYTLGWWGLVKYWLMPWFVYHFWMSTFTLVHHTDPTIPFKPKEEWNEVRAQLNGTIHCKYPRWVEFLCHDINVHIPHHLSTAIPSYNLRKAYAAIKENWGEYCQEREFSWGLMKEIVDQCHLYDPDAQGLYQTFKAYHQKQA